jgi:hypothetical protein
MRPTSPFPMSLLKAFSAAAVWLLAAPAALAQKTDVIVLFNGDHITGEIKSYNAGRVILDTDIASDISIKWNKIISITSDKVFEAQTSDGLYHYGTLAPSTPPGKLVIVSDGKTESVEFLDVVRLSPLYATFWRRVNGSVDLGFNYTEANQFVQFTLGADASVRKPAFSASSSLSAFFTSQEGVPSSQRGNFLVSYEKFLGQKWFVGGFGGVDRNLDLGLDWRFSLGAGFGREFIQTNQTELKAIVGISGNHELPVEGSPTSNAAAVIGATYSAFTYDFPKMNFAASISVLPYLTEAGRVRLEFLGSAKREIVRDFYLSLSIFDSYDSRDPSTHEPKNDWGPTLAIGYEF